MEIENFLRTMENELVAEAGSIELAAAARQESPKIDASPAGHPDVQSRNSQCPCGSGIKYKRCCGVHAPPVLGS
jgi:uncharacterized protein YecA (UPF0149 family)